jgi:hypothetical protein
MYSNPSVYKLNSFLQMACKAKTHKTKINFWEEFPGTVIGLREEGAHISENWLVNWKTGINLCISYKQKLVNWLLVYQGITVHATLHYTALHYTTLLLLNSVHFQFSSLFYLLFTFLVDIEHFAHIVNSQA